MRYKIDSEIDVIEHFGVKGMKWGIRRSLGNRQARLAKESRAEAKRLKGKKGKEEERREQLDFARDFSRLSKANLAKADALKASIDNDIAYLNSPQGKAKIKQGAILVGTTIATIGALSALEAAYRVT